jgi:hypothetical protein
MIEKDSNNATRALAFNVALGALGNIVSKRAERVASLPELVSVLRAWGAPVEKSVAWSERVAQ